MTSWIDARRRASESDEELLLRDPCFRERVAHARASLREGQGLSIEELRDRLDIRPQAAKAEE
jgi:hypothetical protein